MQSTGLMDVTPGNEEKENTFIDVNLAEQSLDKFKDLMNKLNYPYQGNLKTPVPVVTGATFSENPFDQMAESNPDSP